MSQRTLVVSKAFEKSARTIDKPSLERICKYPDDVGDYRVIVEFRDTELLLVAVDVGHRSTIYQE